MKKIKLLLAVAVLSAGVLATSCQKEENVAPQTEQNTQNETQPYTIETVTPTPELIAKAKQLKEEALTGRRGACTFGSDENCDDAKGSVKTYINSFCATNGISPSGNFTGKINTLTFNFSIYVDSDDDINLDRYENTIKGHVAILNTLYPNMFTYLTNSVTWSCNGGYGYRLASIKYTVFH